MPGEELNFLTTFYEESTAIHTPTTPSNRVFRSTDLVSPPPGYGLGKFLAYTAAQWIEPSVAATCELESVHLILGRRHVLGRESTVARIFCPEASHLPLLNSLPQTGSLPNYRSKAVVPTASLHGSAAQEVWVRGSGQPCASMASFFGFSRKRPANVLCSLARQAAVVRARRQLSRTTTQLCRVPSTGTTVKVGTRYP